MNSKLRPINQHEKAIEQAISKAIANLDKGTVGIGDDCLWQLTVRHIQNGPTGTNAAFVAREMFNVIIAKMPYRRFIYRQS